MEPVLDHCRPRLFCRMQDTMAGLSSVEHAKWATQRHVPIRNTFYQPDFALFSLTTASEIVESMNWAHPSCRTARATLSEL